MPVAPFPAPLVPREAGPRQPRSPEHSPGLHPQTPVPTPVTQNPGATALRHDTGWGSQDTSAWPWGRKDAKAARSGQADSPARSDPTRTLGVWAACALGPAGEAAGGSRRGRAAAPARQRTGRPAPSRTRTCPGPPRSSPAPRARGRPRGPAGRPGRRAGRWLPGPQRTRAAPWGSRPAGPGWLPAGAQPPRAAAGPGRSRSRGGRGRCHSAGLRAGGRLVTGWAVPSGQAGDQERWKGAPCFKDSRPSPGGQRCSEGGVCSRRGGGPGGALRSQLCPPKGQTGQAWPSCTQGPLPAAPAPPQ